MRNVLSVVAVAVFAMLTACSAGYAGDVPVLTLPLSTGTTIVPVPDSDESRIEVYSESGIGEAQFWVTNAAGPADLTLRLHLRGLEQLTYGFGDSVIRASVSSQSGNAVRQTLSTGEGEATPIARSSPYWLDITASELVDGLPAYFDVKLPPAFYRDAGMFRLQWIDFYR